MRKEYSDLPKNERKTYVLDQILGSVVPIVIIIPLLVPIFFIAETTQSISEIQNEAMKQNSLRSAFDYLYDKTSEQMENILNIMLYLLLLAAVGIMAVCLVVCEVLKRHFKLYTQFDLDRAERKLKRIKEALSNEA